MTVSEDEELSNLRQLIEAEECGDHNTLGKVQADYLRAFSNVESEDGVSKTKKSKTSKARTKENSKKFRNGWNQSVSKLLKQKRHKKPVILSPKTTVYELSKLLCAERRNAALVRDDISGKIIGIITDAGTPFIFFLA